MSALAKARLHRDKARHFLEAAELEMVAELLDPAVSNAVTAGINAKDAIGLASVGVTSKSDDHRAAVKELEASGLVGKRVAPTLRRLIGLKSKSQYGADGMTVNQARSAVAWATALVAAAEESVASR